MGNQAYWSMLTWLLPRPRCAILRKKHPGQGSLWAAQEPFDLNEPPREESIVADLTESCRTPERIPDLASSFLHMPTVSAQDPSSIGIWFSSKKRSTMSMRDKTDMMRLMVTGLSR